jgi:hypothetical protein
MNLRTGLVAAAVLATAGGVVGVVASNSASADEVHVQTVIIERLTGFQEDPLTINSPGSATLVATINDKDQTIDYRLSWKGLATDVVQAHIHLGQESQSGGVIAFLCGGDGAPACPAGDATVTGTITPANVLGPTAQGLAAGDFDSLVRAIRANATYANIHTAARPTGELRANIGDHI